MIDITNEQRKEALREFDLFSKAMFKEKAINYKAFFMGIKLLKPLMILNGFPQPIDRANLLERYYFYMRYMDEIADADLQVPFRKEKIDTIEFLQEKISNIDELEKGITPQIKDKTDLLFLECFFLAQKLNIHIYKETKLILTSMLFDALRRKRYKKGFEIEICSKEDLILYYFRYGLTESQHSLLKIFGENISNDSIIDNLSFAVRYYYNTRDFVEDMNAGLCNISVQDMKSYNITYDDILKLTLLPSKRYNEIKKSMIMTNLFSDEVTEWLLAQMTIGLKHILEYENKIKNVKIKPVTKLTLELGLKRNAKSFLKRLNKRDYKE